MRVEVTDRARAVVDQARQVRSGTLTITIGTGCCESTAPFLYEDFWPGPDQAAIGDVDGVTVYAPAYLRALYPEDEAVRLDVVDELAESLSIETEFGCRLVLRGSRSDSAAEPDACDVEAAPVSALRPRGPQELPEALRRAHMR
jgi:uncharacterized protein (DUF779 family)